MEKTLFEKLMTSDVIKELVHADISEFARSNPMEIEMAMQEKIRLIGDLIAEISCLTYLLAKLQSDRFFQLKNEKKCQREFTNLHMYLTHKYFYSWSGQWVRYRMCRQLNGQYVPRSKVIPMGSKRIYPMSTFKKEPDWSKHMAEDVETNLALLREIRHLEGKIRFALFNCSIAIAKYFDNQPECQVHQEKRSLPVNASELHKRFINQYGKFK